MKKYCEDCKWYFRVGTQYERRYEVCNFKRYRETATRRKQPYRPHKNPHLANKNHSCEDFKKEWNVIVRKLNVW